MLSKNDIWFCYIISTDKNSLYTGITNNLIKRFGDHLKGKGAKFFRITKPVEIVYYEVLKDRSTASKREFQIKKLSRKEKDQLIIQGISFFQIL